MSPCLVLAMDILPCWQKELGIIKSKKDGKASVQDRFRPDVPDCHQKRITYVSRTREAREMLEKAQELKISYIGLGALFKYTEQFNSGLPYTRNQ